MAYLNFKISNIYSPNDFKVQYKESNNVGSLTDGFTDYNGIFSGGTTNIVVSGVTLNFSSTYWIKILDLLNDSFIIENVLTNSLDYYYNFCPPEPTPTVTPTMMVTPTPSVTPEVSPQPTPSVTVTVTPSQPLVPVTPTVTPTITPTASPVVGYYYKRFVDCNNNYCYMTLATYNYNVNYNGLVLTVGNKYDYQGTIYTYVDDIVLYTNSPSCLLGNITLVTPYVIYYNGFYEYPDPLHPNGGTLVYIDDCGVQQTISNIFVTENCQQVTVLSVVSHVGLTIDCEPVQYVKFLRCAGGYCYMDMPTFNSYGVGYFQTGDRFYGAIEGDYNYLYQYIGQTVYLTSTPSCVLVGVTRTTNTC